MPKTFKKHGVHKKKWRQPGLAFKRRAPGAAVASVAMAVVPRARPSWGEMSYGKGPFPREFFTKLTYGENISLTSTTGALATYQFAMNDLYDPNFTGTGHQPRFFDTLCGNDNTTAPYQKFQVYKSKMSAVCTSVKNPDTTGGGNMALGIICSPNDTIGIPSSINELIERNDATWKTMSYLLGNRGQVRLSKWADVANVLGLRRIEDGGDDTVGSYSASPTLRPMFTIFQQPMDGAGTGTNLWQVQIEFWVRFYFMNDVSDS